MSFDLVRTFVTVSRTGSISEAARLIGISQPTASAHLAALERMLGYPLAERSASGVVLTPRGEALARAVASSVDTIEDALGGPSRGGALQLAGPAELLSTMIVPRLDVLVAAAGGPVRVSFGLADDLLEALRAGALDLVVSAVRPRVRGVVASPLYDEEFVLVAAPVWAETPIGEIPVVAYADSLPIIRRYWQSEFGRRPDAVRTAAVVPDLRGILTAVENGLGMSVLPDYLARPSLDTGRTVLLHHSDAPPLNTVHLAVRTGALDRDARLRAVADAVRELVSDFR